MRISATARRMRYKSGGLAGSMKQGDIVLIYIYIKKDPKE